MRQALSLFIFLFPFVLLTQGSFAKEQFPFIAQVKTSEVNLRAGQNVNFEKMAVLKQGEEVVVVGQEYAWFKVQVPPQAKIYIHADYVQRLKKPILEVTGSQVNIRADKRVDSSIIGKVKKGDLLKEVSQDGDWVQVEPLPTFYGWIHEDYLTPTSGSVPATDLQAVYKQQIAPPQISVEDAVSSAPSISLENLSSVAVSGVLEYDAAFSATPYQLKDSQQNVYLIEGAKDILKNFVSSHVKVEGLVRSETVNGQTLKTIRLSKIQFIL